MLKGANFVPFSVAEIADGRDRALANRLVTVALRRHGQLNLMLARYLDRGVPKKSGPFEAILRISLAHLVFLPELGDHSAIFLAVEAAKRDTRSQHLGKLMNAVLRRAQPAPPREQLRVGDLLIDLAAREVTVATRRIVLTHFEFELLATLARAHGRVRPWCSSRPSM